MENNSARTSVYSCSAMLNCIIKTDLNRGEMSVLAADAKSPRGIAFDVDGNLYFAESGTNSIRVIEPKGTRAFATKLSLPYGLAMGKDGNLYVADSDSGTIKIIDQQGRARDFAGVPDPVRLALYGEQLVVLSADGNISKFNLRGEGGPFHKLELPATGMACDGDGNIYVSGTWVEFGIPVIKKIDREGRASNYLRGVKAGKFDVLGHTGNGYLMYAQGNDTLMVWRSQELSFGRMTAFPVFAAVRWDFNFPG